MKKELLDELKKEVERLNNDEEWGYLKTDYYLYHFSLIEEDGDYYLIDHTEESYYEPFLVSTFVKICKKYDAFLDVECPGRYLIIK